MNLSSDQWLLGQFNKVRAICILNPATQKDQGELFTKAPLKKIHII